MLKAQLNLDLPSCEDNSIRQQLDIFESYKTAWSGVESVFAGIAFTIQVLITSGVFVVLLYKQPFFLIYALFNLLPLLLPTSKQSSLYNTSKYQTFQSEDVGDLALAWVATCNEKDFITMAGIEKTSNRSRHQKEIIVGNLQNYLVSSKAGSTVICFTNMG